MARAGELSGQLEEIVQRVRLLEGERAKDRDKAKVMRAHTKRLEQALAQLDRLSRY